MLPFDHYLRRMIVLNASDLYLRPAAPVAYRVAGLVQRTDDPPPTHDDLHHYIEQILTPVALEQFRQSPDIDAAFLLPGVGRFRINCFMQQGRPALAARLIPLGAVEFDTLHLPPSILEFADAPHGLVLVVGPTGCGKSTTLASLIHHINATRAQHIITIEDPIEFVHDELKSIVHQRQVGYDTRDFATALRHVVRQNPDVILIGEMRDADTIQTALSAALTGHLVLSTLHTTNVIQSIDRMLTYFPPEARRQAQIDLSTTLVGMASMRLLPTQPDDQAGAKRSAAPGSSSAVSNFRGRRPAVEILRATPTVRRLIADGELSELADLMKRSTDAGMCTMNQSLAALVRTGRVDPAVALHASPNPEELKLNLQGMFTGIDSIRITGSLKEEKENSHEDRKSRS